MGYVLKMEDRHGERVISSMSVAKRAVERLGAGARVVVAKECDSDHRRHPDTILTVTFTAVQCIRACPDCGLIVSDRVRALAGERYYEEIRPVPPGECRCALCAEWRALPAPRFGVCGCGRTSILGKPCPLCGGPRIDVGKPSFLRWVGYRRHIPELEGAKFLEDYGWYLQGERWWEMLAPEDFISLDPTEEDVAAYVTERPEHKGLVCLSLGMPWPWP